MSMLLSVLPRSLLLRELEELANFTAIPRSTRILIDTSKGLLPVTTVSYLNIKHLNLPPTHHKPVPDIDNHALVLSILKGPIS